MTKFEIVRYKNFLSTGDNFTEIDLTRNKTTLIVGMNGSGKCLHRSTEVSVDPVDLETRKKLELFIKKSE